MAAVADAEVHSRVTRASTAETATALQKLFGQKLTALLAGIRDPRTVGEWAQGGRAPHPETEQRLRDAYYIASLLLEVESPQTVRAWFMGMNPKLGDRAPALALSEGRAEDVVVAARTFIANG